MRQVAAPQVRLHGSGRHNCRAHESPEHTKVLFTCDPRHEPLDFPRGLRALVESCGTSAPQHE
eukprot:scaffold81106_cov31-Tisochrysis_lutea.AAC.2